jgi:outer membrane protein assembly factor BamB
MPSPNLGEIVTTTLRNRSGELQDNVTNNNALLSRLKKSGKVKPVSGGRTIVEEMSYAENATFMWYSGYDQLNISPSDVLTAAEFNFAQAAVAVSMSGLEELQNSGSKEQVIDLLEARIENAMSTMANNIALAVYSDGTGYGGRQIGGLQLLIADNPTTGTVGGINRANWPFYRNQKFSGTTDGGAAITSANITGYMNQLYLRTCRGADKVDLIIADNNYFNLYWQSLQAIQRITSDNQGQAGFMSLKYMGADVVFDGGIGGGCPANHMYFLNSKYIKFRPHSKRNMVPIGGERMAVNQDAMVKLVGFAGNMTLSNAMLQGVLIA